MPSAAPPRPAAPPRIALALLPLALAACAHAPPPVRSVPIEAEISSAGPRPYLRTRVAGAELLLLLDTGAPANLMPAELARAKRIFVHGAGHAEVVIDANGYRTTLEEAPDVPVLFEGAARPAPVDFLLDRSGQRGSGVLAPQSLLAPGWAMTIDLANARLRFDPLAEALAGLAGGRAPPTPVEARGCAEEGLFDRRHRVVKATVNGVPAEMLVDTGAERTSLARNNPALRSLASAKGRRGGVSGLSSTGVGLELDEVPLEVAGARFALPVLVLPASSSCWDGVLGTDLLRHCTIVWGWDDLWLECRAPAAAAPARAQGGRGPGAASGRGQPACGPPLRAGSAAGGAASSPAACASAAAMAAAEPPG